MLEAGTKKFEDLEFQQLERESSLEEERETMSQQLLQERAEYHCSVAKRKARRLCLNSQLTFLCVFGEIAYQHRQVCDTSQAFLWPCLPGEGVCSGDPVRPAQPAGVPGVRAAAQ